jgi:predicted RNA-binding Zn ribbon-like protein
MANGGQNAIEPTGAGPQPGGREPAPGELGLVQAFVNSNYDLEFDHGADLLADPAALRAWLLRRGLIEPGVRVGPAERGRALAVRDGLRALLIANNGGQLDYDATNALDQAARHAPIGVTLASGEPRFEPHTGGVDGALATILAAVARSMLDGTWARFKACRQHDCRWAFYDHSRNAAGNWCSMRVCGGRAKQRAYYRRRR